jgi:cysteine desulfurase
MGAEAPRLATLRRRFLDAVRTRLPEIRLNGDPERRVAGNLSLTFPGIDAELLLDACPSVAVSTGSACSSASLEPSYVLRALGLDEAAARGSIRVCFGRFTSEAEVDFAADALVAAARRLKAGMPEKPMTKAASGAT